MTAENKYNTQNTKQHILVCLSPAPSNTKIVQTAAAMAKAFEATFTAIFVQTPEFEKSTEDSKSRLADNISLAQYLGATVVTLYGNDVAYRISEYARLSAVTKIVMGRSGAVKKYFWSKPPLTEQLIALAPNTDIHIIPDRHNKEIINKDIGESLVPKKKDLAKTLAVVLIVTLVGLLFSFLNINETNIIMLYILGVLVTTLITDGYSCGIISSLISVPLFDFLFTEPRFSFYVNVEGYPVTFLIMLIVSLIAGTLTTRLKQSATQSARSAYRTKILFDTNQLLQKAGEEREILTITGRQIMKLLGRDVVVYGEKDGKIEDGISLSVNPGKSKDDFRFISEVIAARWAFANNRPAGPGTDNITDSKGIYIPVSTGKKCYGVIGITADIEIPDFFEQSIITSIIGECALAIENIRNANAQRKAAEKIKSEQLRSDLLRTISHDLRTPLTAISGNADNLLTNYDKMDKKDVVQAFNDIYDDSQWLIGVVENILSVTRIDEDRMKLNMSDELIEDVINEALTHINRKKKDHIIAFEPPQDILMAPMDAKLIMQVVINLVENALKYTPRGSKITVQTGRKSDTIYVSVADNGPGIRERAKSRVFDMFYTDNKKTADSRRSLGLGLSLCKSIVEAHGGTITLTDNQPTGCIFTFTLPLSEVKIYE